MVLISLYVLKARMLIDNLISWPSCGHVDIALLSKFGSLLLLVHSFTSCIFNYEIRNDGVTIASK